jgi:hypothetical protein
MQRHVPVGELLNRRTILSGETIMRGSSLAAVTIAAMLAAASAQAQDRKPDAGDRSVAQYTCKDVMRESGGNRDVAIAFLHGFLLGQSGGSTFNVETLRKQTDAFIERCLDNPGLRAADVMGEIRK